MMWDRGKTKLGEARDQVSLSNPKIQKPNLYFVGQQQESSDSPGYRVPSIASK